MEIECNSVDVRDVVVMRFKDKAPKHATHVEVNCSKQGARPSYHLVFRFDDTSSGELMACYSVDEDGREEMISSPPEEIYDFALERAGSEYGKGRSCECYASDPGCFAAKCGGGR